MPVLVVIPARMPASRLPGKPLADIAGRPMIVHVWRRAVEAAVRPVLVAVAEPEIAEAVRLAAGEAGLAERCLKCLLSEMQNKREADEALASSRNAPPERQGTRREATFLKKQNL